MTLFRNRLHFTSGINLQMTPMKQKDQAHSSIIQRIHYTTDFVLYCSVNILILDRYNSIRTADYTKFVATNSSSITHFIAKSIARRTQTFPSNIDCLLGSFHKNAVRKMTLRHLYATTAALSKPSTSLLIS